MAGVGGGMEWQCKEGKEAYQGQRVQRSPLMLNLGQGMENSRWKLRNSQCRSAKGSATPPSLLHPSASARTGAGLPVPQLCGWSVVQLFPVSGAHQHILGELENASAQALSPGQLYQHPWGGAPPSQVMAACSGGGEPPLAITSVFLHPLPCFSASDFSNSEVGTATPSVMSYVTGLVNNVEGCCAVDDDDDDDDDDNLGHTLGTRSIRKVPCYDFITKSPL